MGGTHERLPGESIAGNFSQHSGGSYEIVSTLSNFLVSFLNVRKTRDLSDFPAIAGLVPASFLRRAAARDPPNRPRFSPSRAPDRARGRRGSASRS